MIQNEKILMIAMMTIVLSACMTDRQILDKYQGEAIAAAESEARFTMNCDNLNSQVLNSKIDEFPERIWLNRMPIERQEYTVGVEGCGERRLYKLICRENEGCSAFR